MSIASQTLSHLQTAGSAVHEAAQALRQELQAHSQALMDQMALQPFGPQVDAAYQQMRQVARLVHEINSLEQQLKAIYLDAAQKAQAELPVLPALPSANRRRRLARSLDVPVVEQVEDAQVVEMLAAKPKTGKTTAKKSKGTTSASSKLSNTERLHTAFRKLLGKKAKAVGHAELAALSGLPRGSIGASIKKLIETQKLAVDTDGAYRLI
ncbi:MAG: hypothetical protein EKK45_21085 [Curvibacter sp.]|nr:MAG: hypothetical protein EKK45_21085 [Curvibacter sp.]